MPRSDLPEQSQAGLIFKELVAAFGDMQGVALGRRFGCWCIKLQRDPLIVLDGDQLAFSVGNACELLPNYPRGRLWNPREGRQAKRSWIATPAFNLEQIATLGAIAYQRAVAAAVRRQSAK
jgi:hypothetical protein